MRNKTCLRFKLLTGLIFLAFTAGCSSLRTYNPATGRNEFIFISTDQEVAMGNSVHKQLLQEYKLSNDIRQQARLETIGRRVAKVSDRQDYEYNFYLVEKDELNAFTTPGGNIYVFTGLISKLKTDDQLAAVLAHEIGHCAAKHVVKKYQAAFSYNLIGSVVSSRVQGGALAARGVNAAVSLIFTAYSREDEYQADTIGVRYLYFAGFDPDAMAGSLQVLMDESKGPKVPVFLKTHPHLEDRIEKVKIEAMRYKPNKPKGAK